MAIKKKIFEIKFAYVINDTAETTIEDHLHHYTMPCKTVICDSDGVTGDHISNQQQGY
jgi:hypothetical protein